jgi:hypothetical protein
MHLTREELIAAASKLDGFEGGVWLVDREASRFLSVTFWQSEEQLRESEEPVGRLRELAMIKVGGTVESVEPLRGRSPDLTSVLHQAVSSPSPCSARSPSST